MRHNEMVAKLAKPGKSILDSLTAESCDVLHMAVGISGEAGELLDAIKKHVIYGKPLDRENVVEELGDIEFYIEGLRQALDITRDETIEANIEKLWNGRYKAGAYSDAAAIGRADKCREGRVVLRRHLIAKLESEIKEIQD